MLNPIKQFRQQHNLSKKELASACGLTEQDISQIEIGNSGIPGELQDLLANQYKVNVSELASEQSAFIANRTGDKKSA